VVLFGIDFGALWDAVKNFLGSLGQLIDTIEKKIAHVFTVWDTATKLKDSVLEEIEGWKNFKQDIRLKQRVINLERAIGKTKELIEGIPEAWHSIIDIVNEAKRSLKETTPEGLTSDLLEDFKAASESGTLKAFFEKFPSLARAAEKLVGVLAIIFDAVEKISTVIDDLQTIVDELKRIRLEIEKLDTIFLPQSNKRKVLHLSDGSTIKIRLGKLHS